MMHGWQNEPTDGPKGGWSILLPIPSGGVGGPHFVVNQPLSLQNGSGTQSPSYKMVCL